MNLGKIGFDPGHYAGVNIGPNGYIEGNEMLKLGLMLKSETGAYITRIDGKDISLADRAKLAKQAGVNTLISLHSNYPTDGVMVLYSVKRAQDKEIAEWIGKNIAAALGIKFTRTLARPSTHGDNVDYYGLIRNGIACGLDHVFIVEHGSHKEMSVDTHAKLEKIVQCYKQMFTMTPEQAISVLQQSGILSDSSYWLQKCKEVKYLDTVFVNMAKKLKGE